METYFTFLAKRASDCSSLLCIDLTAPAGQEEESYHRHMLQETARYAAAYLVRYNNPAETGSLLALIKAETVRLGSMIPVIVDIRGHESIAMADIEAIGSDYRACALLSGPWLDVKTREMFLSDQEKGLFLIFPNDHGDWVESARLARSWNDRDNVGLAALPASAELLGQLRKEIPAIWLLAPVGSANTVDLAARLDNGLRRDGQGLLLLVGADLLAEEKPGRMVAGLRDAVISSSHS